MTRAATITQASIRRAIRAAKAENCPSIEVVIDGARVVIRTQAEPESSSQPRRLAPAPKVLM